RVAVFRGDIERGRTDIRKKMASELDVRRIARRAAFLAERALFPVRADVRVGAVLEQRLRKVERGHASTRERRRVSSIADAGGAVASRLSQPRQRMKRRA